MSLRAGLGLLLAVTVIRADGSEFSDANAKSVCDRVVRWVNDGSISRRFVEMRQPSESEEATWRASSPTSSMQYINSAVTIHIRHRDRMFLGIAGGGSCSWPALVEIPGVGRIGDAWSDDDDLRWASWGADENLMVIDGEPFAVAGKFDRANSQATLVSWIAADGRVQPICSLERDGREVLKPVEVADHRLCRAVRSARVELATWKDADVPRERLAPLAATGMPAGMIVQKRTTVDIDADGVEDQITLIDYSSGKGCGSDHQWLVAAGPSGDIDPKSPINAMLLAREWGPIRARHINDPAAWPHFFSHRGRLYLKSAGENTSIGVVSFEGGTTHTWCEFRILPVHRVKRYYPLSGAD